MSQAVHRNPQESLKFADWERSTPFCFSLSSTHHSFGPPALPVCPSSPESRRRRGGGDGSEDKDPSFNLDSAMGESVSASTSPAPYGEAM